MCTRGECTTVAVDGDALAFVVAVAFVVALALVGVGEAVVVAAAADVAAAAVDESGAPSSRTNSRGTQPRLLPVARNDDDDDDDDDDDNNNDDELKTVRSIVAHIRNLSELSTTRRR